MFGRTSVVLSVQLRKETDQWKVSRGQLSWRGNGGRQEEKDEEKNRRGQMGY